ncbi:MAG: RHS repeat-associated core domain-containing protein [Proteobacteria bacterium]|nr:RHS repeat-associated core domain-containing protein [Pseudomonadota bacterium]
MSHEYVYSPYGIETDLDQSTTKAKNAQGFDGQRMDKATGYQFLGNGYRAYNPILHRFMQMDDISYSPFGKGGINGYVFGNNNPVMNFDPSGHFAVLAFLTDIVGVTLGAISMVAAISTGQWEVMPTILEGLGVLGSGAGIGYDVIGSDCNSIGTVFFAAIGLVTAVAAPMYEGFIYMKNLNNKNIEDTALISLNKNYEYINQSIKQPLIGSDRISRAKDKIQFMLIRGYALDLSNNKATSSDLLEFLFKKSEFEYKVMATITNRENFLKAVDSYTDDEFSLAAAIIGDAIKKSNFAQSLGLADESKEFFMQYHSDYRKDASRKIKETKDNQRKVMQNLLTF